MSVISEKILVDTKGFGDILNITPKIKAVAEKYKIRDGLIHVFVLGSTASLLITEFEPGLIRDLPDTVEKFISKDEKYYHNIKWGVNNAHSYISASLFGGYVCIPLINSIIELGTCQKIVLIDFDTRRRSRKIVVQIIY